MELGIDSLGGLKPIVGLQVKVVRIWLFGNNSYEVELIRKDCEPIFIKFPEGTNIRILANCKTAYVTCSRIAYLDCRIDIHFASQYIKVY